GFNPNSRTKMYAATGIQKRARSRSRREAHRKCRVLRESSACFHGQVCFLVLVISPRVLVDTGHLFFRQWAFDSRGKTQNQTTRGNHRSLSDQCTGTDYGILAYDDGVKESSPHSNEAMGLDRAAMHRHAMAYGHIIFENQRECASHDVTNRTILDIRIF